MDRQGEGGGRRSSRTGVPCRAAVATMRDLAMRRRRISFGGSCQLVVAGPAPARNCRTRPGLARLAHMLRRLLTTRRPGANQKEWKDEAPGGAAVWQSAITSATKLRVASACRNQRGWPKRGLGSAVSRKSGRQDPGQRRCVARVADKGLGSAVAGRHRRRRRLVSRVRWPKGSASGWADQRPLERQRPATPALARLAKRNSTKPALARISHSE
jgi:hypothetical protein